MDFLLFQFHFTIKLYYRLNVVQLNILPLKERREDILEFVLAFVDEFNEEYHRRVSIGEKTSNVLMNYDWPGNIRELKNVISNSCHMLDGDIITVEDLPFYIVKSLSSRVREQSDKKLEVMIDDFEKEMIVSELKKNQFNCSLTAKTLGIHRSTLYKKMEKHQISIQEKR